MEYNIVIAEYQRQILEAALRTLNPRDIAHIAVPEQTHIEAIVMLGGLIEDLEEIQEREGADSIIRLCM